MDALPVDVARRRRSAVLVAFAMACSRWPSVQEAVAPTTHDPVQIGNDASPAGTASSTNTTIDTNNTPVGQNANDAQNGNASALQGNASVGPGANANLRALSGAFSAASAATGVKADVLAAMAWQESRADPNVAGGGLLQLSDAVFAAQRQAHTGIGASIQDANANSLAAAYYLLELQQAMQSQFARSDLAIVLRAYNSGPDGVDPNDLSALPAGTGDAKYVTEVTGNLAIVDSGAGTLPP